MPARSIKFYIDHRISERFLQKLLHEMLPFLGDGIGGVAEGVIISNPVRAPDETTFELFVSADNSHNVADNVQQYIYQQAAIFEETELP